MRETVGHFVISMTEVVTHTSSHFILTLANRYAEDDIRPVHQFTVPSREQAVGFYEYMVREACKRTAVRELKV